MPMNDSDWAERLFNMLSHLSQRQETISQNIEDIRVKIAEQGQITVRLNYVEEAVQRTERKLEKIEQGTGELRNCVGDIKVDLSALSAHVDNLSGQLERVDTDVKTNTGSIATLIKEWGPWIGILGLFAKEIIK